MPVVTLVLGVSAGHGALTGVFADLIIMTENASLFAAGPPVVLGSLGIEVTPEELGAGRMHTAESGVAHNLAADEDEALQHGASLSLPLAATCRHCRPRRGTGR